MSQLSPSMLNALDGLLQNQGFQVSPAFQAIVQAYQSNPLAASIRRANQFRGKMSDPDSLAIWDAFIRAVPPAISDLITEALPAYNAKNPAAPTTVISKDFGQYTLSDANLNWASEFLYGGDISKFCQLFNAIRAHITQLNSIIDPTSVAQQPSSTLSFRSSEYIVTGGISDLTTNIPLFGTDLENAGFAINFKKLAQLGDPSVLLISIVEQIGGFTVGLVNALAAEGLDLDTAEQIVNGIINPTVRHKASMYRAYTKITDLELLQITAALQVKTLGLTALSDLLDPVKLFPNSYQTLVIRNVNELIPIYVGTEVNPLLQSFVRYKLLVPAVPEPIAISMSAVSVGLRQVSGILDANPISFSRALKSITGTSDLAGIQSLVAPTNGLNTIEQLLGSGTGQNNTYLLKDAMGIVSGMTSVDAYTSVVEKLQSVEEASTALIFHLNRIQETLADDLYTEMIDPGDPTAIPPRGPSYQIVIPGVGAWPASFPVLVTELPNPPVNPYNEAIPALIALAQPVLDQWLIDNAVTVAELLVLYNQIFDQLERELAFRNSLDQELGFFLSLLNTQKSAIMSFAKSLHVYGSDSDVKDTLENMADSTFTGQATKSALREGANIKLYSGAGIRQNPYV